MYELSESRQKALNIAQAYFRRANIHPSALEWHTEAIEAYGFYDGSGQWRLEDLQTLASRKQFAMTINIIQSRLDSLSGVEIQSRFRTAVINESKDESKDVLAQGLTNLLYFYQQDQRIPHKGSLKFRDMLICGLGWSNMYQENGAYYYDYVHPYNVLPDPDDLSPQYDNMKYVCRKRWMEPDVVRRTWRKTSNYIDFSDPSLYNTVYSPEITDRNSNYTNANNYTGFSQSRLLVCEVQHKVPKRCYYGIDSNGFYFETFNEEEAEQLANSTRDIEEKLANQIMRTLFLDNFLLETAPLNPNIPNLKDFSYIPCVWKRRFRTGVPYGLLDSMKDIQRDTNVRLTKALYLANSSRLITVGQLNPGQTSEQLTEDLKMADIAINLPEGTTFNLTNNDPLADTQLRFIGEHDKFMQRVTGIYDDMMGKETNASSGVAQRQRQINSVRNNVFAFDNFADMKERESKFMLSLIQGGFSENILSEVVTEEQKESIILNLSRTINGKKVIFNDVRTLPVSLEIEDVPDYRSSKEEDMAQLDSLLSNPNAMLIMQSPSLLRRSGIRDYQKISDEMKQIVSQQAMNQSQQQNSANDTQDNQNLAYPGL